MPTRLIIGAGVSAAVFLSTSSDDYKTIVVGEDGLWAKLVEHPMGQPAHLLHLPGSPPPKFTVANGEMSLENFLSSGVFQQGVTETVNGSRYSHNPSRKVRRISKSLTQPGNYVAWFNTTHALIVEKIIIATGIGAQRKPPSVKGTPAPDIEYSQVIEGIEFLEQEEQQVSGIDRAIYGGSATAAWVVDIASKNSPKMNWFARPKGSEFTGAVLPGSRNAKIIELCESHNLKLLKEVTEIEYVGKRLHIHVRDEEFCYIADQFIYSLGGDDNPTVTDHIYQIMDPDIRDDLTPVLDESGALGRQYKSVLALANSDKGVMIVGAATYNFTSLAFNSSGELRPTKKKPAPMAHLPWNAQVPDGIAVVVASISALNHYIPIKQRLTLNYQNTYHEYAITENNTNINLADANQLAVLFTLMFDELSANQINDLVMRTIAARSIKNKDSVDVFGLNKRDFYNVIKSRIVFMSDRSIDERCSLAGLKLD